MKRGAFRIDYLNHPQRDPAIARVRWLKNLRANNVSNGGKNEYASAMRNKKILKAVQLKNRKRNMLRLVK